LRLWRMNACVLERGAIATGDAVRNLS
jgi:hypothetical protein